MTEAISTNKKIIGFSFLTWIVPFAVSIFMVDPVTNEYLPNFAVFKVIMFLLVASVTYFIYIKLKRDNSLTVAVPNTFLLINVLLDIAVLIMALQVPITVWLMTILPIYLVVFYGGFYLKK